MLAILEFLLFVFALPYVLIFVFLVKAINALATYLHRPAMMWALWLTIVAMWLSSHMAENPNRPWVSMIERVAQSHLLGVPTPVCLIGAALLLLVLSFVVKAVPVNG